MINQQWNYHIQNLEDIVKNIELTGNNILIARHYEKLVVKKNLYEGQYKDNLFKLFEAKEKVKYFKDIIAQYPDMLDELSVFDVDMVYEEDAAKRKNLGITYGMEGGVYKRINRPYQKEVDEHMAKLTIRKFKPNWDLKK